MTRSVLALPIFLALCGLTGCTHLLQVEHKVEPIKIEITVRVQVERDLEDFFGEIDNAPAAAGTSQEGS